ncbi:MAG: hypothetical protein PHU01_13745 [Desulfuromonadaceae bacterium]|nr:hypothetical protein [Desulfuromonadaceae bacterium]
MNYSFCAYNLFFDSYYEPPGGCNKDKICITPDVTISIGTVAEQLHAPTLATDFFQVSPHNFLMTVRDIARYHVTDGRKIIVEPFPGADGDKIRLFLFGSAMGALLYQRGLFPLHGSAIATKLGVMIFVGPQGIGKSTLIAHFKRRGYYVLSDDVCAITNDGSSGFRVLPAFPQIRLCSDAFERLDDITDATSGARYDVDKYVIPLNQTYSTDNFPLHSIYQLADNDIPEITQNKLQGFDRVNLLISNLYRLLYLPGFQNKGHIMQMSADIAKATTMYELQRPRDTERIEELIDLLEQQWNAQ